MSDATRRRPRILKPKQAEKPAKKPRPAAPVLPAAKAPPVNTGLVQTAKLTPELLKEVCALVEKGLPLDGVCDYLCVTTAAFWEWRRKGEEFLLSGTKGYESYGQFVLALRRSMAKFRLDMTDKWLKADKEAEDWRKFSVMLERRDRKTYARQAPDMEQTEEFNPDATFL